MKELGEYLKTTRENNGVALEEAADDLKTDSFLLEALEQGNVRAFKDVLKIKDLVKDYAKYLGLDSEKVILEYNDFLFEHTSKISLKDIMEAEKKDEKKANEISSPYTYIRKKKHSVAKLKVLGIWFALMLILILIVVLVYLPKSEPVVTELMIGSGLL